MLLFPGARVHRVIAHPQEQSWTISATHGNNEVSMWDVETGARQKVLWASTAPPLSQTQVMSTQIDVLCGAFLTCGVLRYVLMRASLSVDKTYSRQTVPQFEIFMKPQLSHLVMHVIPAYCCLTDIVMVICLFYCRLDLFQTTQWL